MADLKKEAQKILNSLLMDDDKILEGEMDILAANVEEVQHLVDLHEDRITNLENKLKKVLSLLTKDKDTNVQCKKKKNQTGLAIFFVIIGFVI